MKLAVVTLAFAATFAATFACEINNIPPELLNGCIYSSLDIVNPATGFVITGENCGLEIDKSTFYDQPFVFYTEAVDFMRYTLIMVDRDNPLAQDGNLYLHWLSTDIDGQALKYGLGIDSGNTVAAYVPPDPSQETCVHRYSVYIYEQRFHPLEFPELPESRADFNLYDFIGNVVPEGGICRPVASIEFKSRY